MRSLFRYAYWRGREFRQAHLEPLATSLGYALAGRRNARLTPGAHPPGPRAAIYLVFPSAGVQPSHLRSLAYLAGKGYAVTAISNLALTPSDREMLAAHSHRVLERSNVGYDFGGYRDGALLLERDRHKLERLLLLNDSVWFPLPGCRDWIDDVEALGVDVAGAASNLGLARDAAGAGWRIDPRRPSFHYCSYALAFGPRVLADDRFWRYWRRFRMSNDKFETVRRGEVGLSRMLLDAGFSHGSTLPLERLDRVLATLSDDRLAELAAALIIPQDPKLRWERALFLAADRDDPQWRRTAVRFLLRAVEQTGVSYALPELTVREMGFPFLKKSPVALDPEGRSETLRLIGSIGSPIGAEMLAEAQGIAGRAEGAAPSP